MPTFDPDSDGLTIFLYHAPSSFLPGQQISGEVQVHTSEGVKTNGLKISLNGTIQVAISERRRVERGRDWDGHYHDVYETFWYYSNKDIHDDSIELMSGEYEFPPGVYSCPFMFLLPDKLATSFHCQYGGVEYFLLAKLDVEGGGNTNWATKMVIPVLDLMDLGALPNLTEPKEEFDEKRFGCLCKSEPIKMWLMLRKTGFYPGEDIEFQIRVDNKTGKELRDYTAELCQRACCRAEGKNRWCVYVIQSICKSEIDNTPVSSCGEDRWSGKIEVPGVAPSNLGKFEQDIIEVDYFLKIKCIFGKEWCCRKPVAQVTCDVTIGSYPPREP